MSKILRYANEHTRASIGFTCDTAENVTVFGAFIPGSNAYLDLPCIPKASLPDTGYIHEPKTKVTGSQDESFERLLDPGVNVAKTAVKSKRGYRSIELLRLICQQMKLMFGVSLETFFAKEEWYHKSRMGFYLKSTKPYDEPGLNIMSLTADQGNDIVMACQLSRHVGLRLVYVPDHNHRDNNDANFTSPSVSLCIELIGKVANGPFGQGAWFSSILETAQLLVEDEPSCKK